MKRFLSIVLFGIVLNFHAIAQFTISAAGPTDVCFTPVTLNVVNPQPGYVYDWYVTSYACSGGFGTPAGPYATGDVMQAFGTGEFVCYGTGPGGIPEISNPISIRTMPGSVGSMHLPLPYPINQVTCTPSVSLCIPTAFYLNFTTIINWYKDNVQIAGASSPGYVATTPGWYKYTITSPCATDYSDSVYFSPGAAGPVITGPNAICQGNSTVFDAGGGYSSYLWSTGTPTQSITVNSAGTYTVTVTDGFGCTATSSRILTVNPNPVPQITGNSILCLPQTTTLNAGGGYILYQWNIGTVSQTITVSSIGTYTVTVTDNNGCTGSDSLEVTGLVVTMNGNATICSGSSTNLVVQFAGTPPFYYSFSEGTTVFGPFGAASNPVIITVSPSVSTTYFLVSAGDANCAGTVTGSATITISSAPVITTSDSTLCQSQTTVLDAGSGWTGYLWSTGATTQAITVSSLNNYTVTVTDASGCTGSDNIFIGSQLPYITALSSSGSLGICLGDSVQLIAPSPMVFYQWYKNNVLIQGATSSTFWASVYGKYKCQSLDPTGCEAISDPVKVSIVCFPPLPPEEKSGQLFGETSTITLFPNPSQGVFNYELPDILSSTVHLQVSDLLGNVIKTEALADRIGTIDLSAYAAGVYFLKVNEGNSSSKVKLIKTN